MKLTSLLLVSLFFCLQCASDKPVIKDGELLDYDANKAIWQERVQSKYFSFYHTHYGPTLVKELSLKKNILTGVLSPPSSIVYHLTVKADGSFVSRLVKKAPLPFLEMCEQELAKLKLKPASAGAEKMPAYVFLVFHFTGASQ